MAQFTLTLTFLSIFMAPIFMSAFVISQPPLNAAEQEYVYKVLESINSDISWRALFPDDLCSTAPHGVICDYFTDDTAAASDPGTPHVTELSFGYVSDYSPNPPCSSNSTLDPSVLAPLSHLKKLFFYKCFTETKTPFPDFSPLSSQTNYSPLEELVFIENPALIGSLDGKISNLTSLRRLVLTGCGVSGGVSNGLGELVNLEQLTLSRNKFNGEISMTIFQNMKKLKVLDLSENGFQGNIPESIGNSTELLKIDLSFNAFSGRIPEVLKGLTSLEFLDLSYNSFRNYGVPLLLGEMPSLREVYLSGNFLGGRIPEIWGNLKGIRGIGLSGVGLVGNIPKSMGVHLRNLCYLGLDNNRLEGVVPEEFGDLEFMSELNLANNSLSGRLPFSAGFLSILGGKLKLEGNLDICIDEGLKSAKVSSSLGELKVCRLTEISSTALFYENSGPRPHASLAFITIGLFVFLNFSKFYSEVEWRNW
ncbi:Leucine-rich repeat (LRR) protein associated with apoptosis in muscle tissue [Handroanthus impetiginosus]|uniref:Leucine-rich repeat (LRR) protein associated with apoptosis in muscle tissue n=1 Tax=Handroanthus impetiginosus TaxID=429701 RepID=A0A2G9GHE2_9LAMI|nr:Leucine-rich repeat (LRR) protein associated with apoptosis in muscle tissue [Handroanthus impetiginosus]